MPQNPESSIPLDDDDILDLTEVAGPEKEFDGPSEPGSGGGVDFGAELDALLDSLAPSGTVSAPSAQVAEAAAAKSPVAAPIKNQTPVSHRVDPNEEMAMPETSDIDSLLAELGAQIPADPLDPPVKEAPAPKVAAPIADFDNLLARAKAAEAQKVAEEAAAPVAAPAVAVPEMAPEIDADDADSLDLNELDALLDDILATAPEMSAPAQRMQPAPAAAPTMAPPIEIRETPVEEPVEEPVGSDAVALPEADGVPGVISVPETALMPNAAPDASLEARVRRLEDAAEVLETEGNNQLSETMVDALIDAKIAALLAPGSGVVATIVKDVLTRLTTPEADGESAADFREKLEKMAAAAAAKVIREEIAALMSE